MTVRTVSVLVRLGVWNRMGYVVGCWVDASRGDSLIETVFTSSSDAEGQRRLEKRGEFRHGLSLHLLHNPLSQVALLRPPIA